MKTIWIRFIATTLFLVASTNGFSENISSKMITFRVHSKLRTPSEFSSTDPVVFLKLIKSITTTPTKEIKKDKKWFYKKGSLASKDGKVWLYPSGRPINAKGNWFYENGKLASADNGQTWFLPSGGSYTSTGKWEQRGPEWIYNAK